MTAPVKELLEFDSFRLDPAEHLLLRDGEPVPLEPKVFETLLVLIRHGGRLVSKEELMQAVWPDSFVEESNLTRNISVLRKALNRNDSRPQYIETVPKRGYRFTCEVRALTVEQTELVLQTAKVSVVIEEEESDEQINEQGARAARPDDEVSAEREQRVTIELKQRPADIMKRRRLSMALILAMSLIGIAATIYFISSGGSRQTIDSLADRLINGLSQLPGLKVLSRNSTLRYKGGETDAQAVGKQLGVRAVLTGRVMTLGDSLSISIELVDAQDNSCRTCHPCRRRFPATFQISCGYA
jgi:DNA-binding winged helix-turn-helix (wHTH) protein